MGLTLKPETHLTKQPPPPLHHSFFHLRPPHPGGSFPVIAVAVIGILATAFLLVSYYIFVIKCCLNWHRIDLLRRLSSPRHRPSSASCATEPRGLDDSLIRAIPIINFHKDSNEKGSVFECAVCLSEFEEEEKLRVIPNCCHAFHIDCIDVWLQTNANCPLCRSIISPNSLISIDQKINISSGSQNLDLGNENFTGNDEDYVVIEIQDNNLDQPRLVSAQERSNSDELSAFSISPSPKKGTKLHKKLLKQGKVASFGDECIELRNKDEEFQIIQPIRRSISMDSSKDRQFYLQIQEEIQQRNGQVNEVSFNSEGCSSRSVKRSIFSLNNDSEKGSRRDV